jgi:hypothetical protein
MCGINTVTKNAVVMVAADGHAVGVLSWDGFHKAKQPRHKLTEDDVVARMMWLVSHGMRDEAEDLLYEFCLA